VTPGIARGQYPSKPSIPTSWEAVGRSSAGAATDITQMALSPYLQEYAIGVNSEGEFHLLDDNQRRRVTFSLAKTKKAHSRSALARGSALCDQTRVSTPGGFRRVGLPARLATRPAVLTPWSGHTAYAHPDHEDLKRGVIHVWKSASKSGDTKTPKFKRSLELIREPVLDPTGNCQPPTGHPANDLDE
jgi:hypothetical protein